MADVQPSPRNPRQRLAGIDQLAESIREYGLLQPVVMRRCGDGYELIAGHRRLEAVKSLGWSQVPAIVREDLEDRAYLLTLTENLQREDLTAKEESAALEVLVRERGWTTRQVGEAIKRSPTYVSRRLRVFEDDVLAPFVLRDELPVSTAEELLREPDARARKELATQATQAGWKQTDARRAVSARCNVTSQVENRTWKAIAAQLRELTDDLAAIDASVLTTADHRLVRRALRALRRLT